MKELIEALQILKNYTIGDELHPTKCSDGVLTVTCVNPNIVTPEDIKRLNYLGFFVSANKCYFQSFRFGK